MECDENILYHFIGSNERPDLNSIWRIKTEGKYSFFIWLLSQNWRPTADRLKAACSLCDQVIEIQVHLFCHCYFTMVNSQLYYLPAGHYFGLAYIFRAKLFILLTWQSSDIDAKQRYALMLAGNRNRATWDNFQEVFTYNIEICFHQTIVKNCSNQTVAVGTISTCMTHFQVAALIHLYLNFPFRSFSTDIHCWFLSLLLLSRSVQMWQ